MQSITHYSQALVARGHVVGAGSRHRLAARLPRVRARVRSLKDDGERGAQAAEYALLGGVSAAACGAMIKVLRDNPDVFRRVFNTIVNMLGRAVGGWF